MQLKKAKEQALAVVGDDHFLAGLKAGLNLFGGPIGSAVASLIADCVPNKRQRSAEAAVKLLGQKLEDLEGRIDIEAVDKDEFAELYNQFEDVARRTNREEKLNAAANIMANVLLKPGDGSKSPFGELDHLMRCVDALSAGAIATLGAAIKLKPPRHKSRGDVSLTPKELGRFMELDDELDLLMGYIAELRALNLVHVTEGLIGPTYESTAIRVTRMGAHFAERFIEGRM
jgi:hypothetical protein